jgi:hypothetical protein
VATAVLLVVVLVETSLLVAYQLLLEHGLLHLFRVLTVQVVNPQVVLFVVVAVAVLEKQETLMV